MSDKYHSDNKGEEKRKKAVSSDRKKPVRAEKKPDPVELDDEKLEDIDPDDTDLDDTDLNDSDLDDKNLDDIDLNFADEDPEDLDHDDVDLDDEDSDDADSDDENSDDENSDDEEDVDVDDYEESVGTGRNGKTSSRKATSKKAAARKRTSRKASFDNESDYDEDDDDYYVYEDDDDDLEDLVNLEQRIGDRNSLRDHRRRRRTTEMVVASAKSWSKQDIGRGIILTLSLTAVVIIAMLLGKINYLWSGLGTLISALTPVLIGLVFAYVLNPLHNLMTKLTYKLVSKKTKTEEKAKKLSAGLGLLLTILIFLGLIVGLLVILLPALKDSLVNLYNKLPTYVENVRTTLNGWFSNSPSVQEVINSYLSNFETMMNTLFKETLLPNMDTILANVTSGVWEGIKALLNVIIGLIFAIYILAQKKKFAAQSKKLLFSVCSKKRGNKVLQAVNYVDSVFGGFVNGKILDSLLIGIMCMLFCSITDMPYGILVSVIIAVTNIIPFFGPFLGLIPSGILILVESPKMALIFVIYVTVIQQLDANLLQPIVLGDATGLSGFWVLFAITVGSAMFGFVGMLVAVPVFAILATLFNMHTRHRLKYRTMTNNTEYYYDLLGFDEKGNPIRGERVKVRKSVIDRAKKSKKNKKIEEEKEPENTEESTIIKAGSQDDNISKSVSKASTLKKSTGGKISGSSGKVSSKDMPGFDEDAGFYIKPKKTVKQNRPSGAVKVPGKNTNSSKNNSSKNNSNK